VGGGNRIERRQELVKVLSIELALEVIAFVRVERFGDKGEVWHRSSASPTRRSSILVQLD